MANLKTIQFLRSNTVYTSLDAAKKALSGKIGDLFDGSPIIGRYTSGATVLSVIGIVHKNATATGVTFFESANDIADKLAQLQAELDAAENAVGLASGGTKIDQSGEYISGKTTIEAEIKALNDALEAVNSVIDGLDYDPIGGTDASVLTQIQQADGRISGLTANVGTLKLTGYEEGSVSGHVESTDSINAAIAKVQNQIDATNDVIGALDASTVSGDSKVVVDVTQNNGQLTATAANLTSVKLDGYSEGTDADIASTDTLGEALGKLQSQINAMDLTVVSGDGEVITAVSENDGKVSAEKSAIKDVKLTGYVKDDSKTGDLAATDDIEDALSKIENNIAAAKSATTLSAADKSINVVTAATGTTVALNIRSGEKVLKLDTDATSGGVYTSLNVVKLTDGLPATVKERYELHDSDDVKIGESIDIAKDSHIVSITYINNPSDAHYQNLQYQYIDVSGNTQTEYVDVSALVLEAEFASGVTVTNQVAHGVVDPTSESFFTVGANGFKVAGISGFVQSSIEDLDVAVINPGEGKYIYAIEENDGKIAASGANVSDAVLNGYSKGSDSTAVAATDDVKGAISKLENQIDKAKAAATTKVVEGTDNEHLTIASATSADESVTYTVTLTDVASDSALTAEITARKAVDGQNGDTYAANTSANYISAAISLNDADVKLDTALKASDDNIAQLRTDVDTLSGKTFTVATSSNASITTAVTAAADGTKSVDLTTDSSQIKLSGFVESSASTEQAPANGDTINQALAKIYATAKHHHVSGSDAINVNIADSGSTVSLILDDTSALSVNNNDGNGYNALMITSDGLFLSKDWDCGTF